MATPENRLFSNLNGHCESAALLFRFLVVTLSGYIQPQVSK
jgi:hypothetical protein